MCAALLPRCGHWWPRVAKWKMGEDRSYGWPLAGPRRAGRRHRASPRGSHDVSDIIPDNTRLVVSRAALHDGACRQCLCVMETGCVGGSSEIGSRRESRRCGLVSRSWSSFVVTASHPAIYPTSMRAGTMEGGQRTTAQSLIPPAERGLLREMVLWGGSSSSSSSSSGQRPSTSGQSPKFSH